MKRSFLSIIININKIRTKTLFIILYLFLVFSCTNETENNNQGNVPLISNSQSLKSNDSIIQSPNKASIQLTVESVDLNSIKSKFKESNTSGILPKSENKNFAIKEPNNFFVGVYYFINSTIKEVPYVAKAIIICEHTGEWNYSNENEELIEFSSYSNLTNPFSEIVSIGQTKEEVFKQLGNSFKEIESNLIYFDSFGNAATILFKKDTVQAIRVGKYKDPNEVMPIKLKW